MAASLQALLCTICRVMAYKSRDKTSLRLGQNRAEAAQAPLLHGSAYKIPVMGKEEFGRCCWLLWDGLDRAGVCTDLLKRPVAGSEPPL